MMRARCAALCLSMVMALPAFGSAAPDVPVPENPHTVSVSLGVEYASGTYGTGSTLRNVYMPLVAAWAPGDVFDFSIELPFVYQNSANITGISYRASRTTATRPTRGSRASGTTVTSDTAATDVYGLGDIILRFGAIAIAEDGSLPMVRPSLLLKCPAADASDGLGTGEFDAGVGLEAAKWIDDLHVLAEGLYTYQGKADGLDLKNFFSYSAGVGYQVTKNIEPMFMIKGATATSGTSGYQLEARARLIWSLGSSTTLDLFGSHGIAVNSPDFGGGVAIVYSF